MKGVQVTVPLFYFIIRAFAFGCRRTLCPAMYRLTEQPPTRVRAKVLIIYNSCINGQSSERW